MDIHAMAARPAAAEGPAERPPFLAFLLYWLKLGCISFGGPAGQIAMMQSELVDRRRWIDQTRFLHALNFCMLLPGPEAQQLATYVGWRIHGILGGVVSGVLFLLPGVAVLMVLSWIAAAHGDAPIVTALFDGVKPAVVAIIVGAVWKVGRRTMKGAPAVVLAASAFLALFWLGVPFPLVVAGAGVIGIVAATLDLGWFAAPHPGDPADLGPAPKLGRLAVLAVVFAILWAVPVLGVLTLLGTDPWRGIVTLFTQAAFVTFGGAYAVLPYVAEQAVEVYGWLTAPEMINGLALAETTPGPLILVLQYVGFYAGWNAPGALSPTAGGIVGGLLTVYVTFLPCFLFIFAGAPYVERLIHNRVAAGALAAITAAVVGVILNLGVYLGLEVLFPGGAADGVAWAIMLAALVTLLRFDAAVHWVVLAGALAGLARAAAAGAL